MDKHGKGTIELIYGPMFSGKTTELRRRLLNAQKVGLTIQAFKPILDSRYGTNYIVTHDGKRVPCAAVQHPGKILQLVCTETAVVGIDEPHLFQDWQRLVLVVRKLAARGKRVILAGLDTDHRQAAFDWKVQLECRAKIDRLEARCQRCGEPARFTQRLSTHNQRIVVGGADKYEPRCGKCHSDGLHTSREEATPTPPTGEHFQDSELSLA